MNFKLFIAMLVVSVLISMGIATMAVSAFKADAVVPVPVYDYTLIGKTEKGTTVTRMEDPSKGVACYILDNHRAMSCVKVSP